MRHLHHSATDVPRALCGVYTRRTVNTSKARRDDCPRCREIHRHGIMAARIRSESAAAAQVDPAPEVETIHRRGGRSMTGKRWDLEVWDLEVNADARDLLDELLAGEVEEVAPVVVNEMRDAFGRCDLTELAADARHLARLGRLLLQLDPFGGK